MSEQTRVILHHLPPMLFPCAKNPAEAAAVTMSTAPAGNPLMLSPVVIFGRDRTPPRTSSPLFVEVPQGLQSAPAVAGSLLSVSSSAFLLSALVNPCNPGGGTLSHPWLHVIWPPVVSQQQGEGEEAVTEQELAISKSKA